jgi:PAS domain S-box-containing protein
VPPALEAEYRGQYLRADGRTAAVIAGGLALLAAAFITTDVYFVGPPTIWVLVALRFTHIAITVALIRAALRSRSPAVLDGWCLAWVAWGALVIVAVQSTRPGDYFLPLTADLLLVVSAWALIPNRFPLQALGAATATVGSVTWMVAFRDRPPLPVALLVAVNLVSANLAAGFVSWRFQRTRRLHFLAEKELADLVVQLGESAERHRSLVENLGAGVVVHEGDTSIRLSNARAAEMLGLTQDQLRGKAAVDHAWRFVRGDGAAMPLDEYPVERVLATKGPVVDQVGGVDRPARNDRVWVLINAYPIFREQGDIDHVVVTFVDITRRKQAEEALQRSEALQRTVMENFPNGVVGLFDRDLRYVLIDGTNTVTATSPRSWKGRTLQELTPPEVLPVIEPAYRAALAGESRRVQIPLAGHLIDVLIEPVRDAAGAVTHGLFMTQDVTEKRALEEQLTVASRLAALGTLVAGVAHEINNPLTAELAGQGLAIEEVQAVRDAMGAGAELDRASAGLKLGEALEALRDAQAGGERIARVVKELTLFGRPDPRRTRVRLADVVETAMRWLPGSIVHVATIQIEDRGAPDVMASPGQLGQVLVNLVTNASRSASGEGKVTVRVVVGPGSQGMAALEVTDDGAGIDPSVLNRIFDPFFTTRKVGEGMGLGLPICHSIVTAHGGTISATSSPGRGSSFRVELPATADPA